MKTTVKGGEGEGKLRGRGGEGDTSDRLEGW